MITPKHFLFDVLCNQNLSWPETATPPAHRHTPAQSRARRPNDPDVNCVCYSIIIIWSWLSGYLSMVMVTVPFWHFPKFMLDNICQSVVLSKALVLCTPLYSKSKVKQTGLLWTWLTTQPVSPLGCFLEVWGPINLVWPGGFALLLGCEWGKAIIGTFLGWPVVKPSGGVHHSWGQNNSSFCHC